MVSDLPLVADIEVMQSPNNFEQSGGTNYTVRGNI